MPKEFLSCVSQGGRVRRISGPNKRFGLSKDQYINICFRGNKMHRGHVKTKKNKGRVK
jgi:hypothetical protein